MRRIHVLTQKELVDPEKIKHATAVVIDVLLATSTIVFALNKGIRSVITVKEPDEGFEIYHKDPDKKLIMGEKAGIRLEGMEYPDPNLFDNPEYQNKETLVLLTTNGTVAVERSLRAKRLFVSSLLNGHMIAKEINEQNDESSIVIVCAGNHNRFSMEDFIGAGQIVHYLISESDPYSYSLSDSSKAALEMYRLAKKDEFNILYSLETSELLRSYGYNESISLVVKHIEKIHLVSEMKEEGIVKLEKYDSNINL